MSIIVLYREKLGEKITNLHKLRTEEVDGIDISEIFDKYTVGASGSVGLGIGLYLCKRIVEMHEGRISASIGTKWGGARVVIVIPI